MVLPFLYLGVLGVLGVLGGKIAFLQFDQPKKGETQTGSP